MSPPGNHELTITVKDDEAFVARDTVTYFLGSDSITTGYINLVIFIILVNAQQWFLKVSKECIV